MSLPRQCRRKAFSGGTLFASVLAAGFVAARGAARETTNAPASSLADLSVEQLMNESVTSVARRETKFNESAAAITVITQDDLRRLGITTIPDALRLVPGVEVAQINSHEWAITARGFDNEFADKLLVLVDGRSVYGTGFGGVVWGVQDVVMEDVDRIEVIRGPGAALWGANAVNGVINIITKRAKETQGALVSVAGGTFDQPATTIRYGGQLATNLFYRAYGKFYRRDGLVTASGQEAPDRAMEFQGGARLDWEPSAENKFTLQGDFYRDRFVENQDLSQLLAPYLLNYNEVNYDSGGNVLGRWTHDFSDTSSLAVQAYYDHFQNEQAGASETVDTIDFDAQHRFALGSRNNLTWGLGYRDLEDDFNSSFFAAWNPPETRNRLLSSFVQDEISLVPGKLKLTLGSKFEHNDYTGFEIEPNARLAWTPTDKQTVWTAISRAVRTPSWTELNSRANLAVIPSAPPVLISTFGNPDLKSEDLIACELGYRVEVTKRVSLDVAGFYNDYSRLIAPTAVATNFEMNPAPPHTLIAATDENAGRAHTYGAEVSAHWDVTDHWHLTANYSWLDVNLEFSSPYLQAAPEQQAQIRSSLDLPGHFELNGMVAHVAQITAPYGMGQMTIPDYIRLDVGVVWHPTPNFEIGLWGQNLATDQHAEFTSYKTALVTEIPRGFIARATWRF